MLSNIVRRIQQATAGEAGRAYFRFWSQLGSGVGIIVGYLAFIGGAFFVAVVPLWAAIEIGRAYGGYGVLFAVIGFFALCVVAVVAWELIERQLAKSRK